MIEDILKDAMRHSHNIFKGKTTNISSANFKPFPENQISLRTRERKLTEFQN